MPALRTPEITDKLIDRVDRTSRGARRPTAPSPEAAAPVARTTLADTERSHAPTTRRLDDKYRLQYRGLAERLGAGPCTFDLVVDGHWAVLTPAATAAPSGTHAVARLGADDRVTLPPAVRTHLGVGPGDEVLVAVLPEHGAIALAHPSVAFLGAPVALLTVPSITHHRQEHRNG